MYHTMYSYHKLMYTRYLKTDKVYGMYRNVLQIWQGTIHIHNVLNMYLKMRERKIKIMSGSHERDGEGSHSINPHY